MSIQSLNSILPIQQSQYQMKNIIQSQKKAYYGSPLTTSHYNHYNHNQNNTPLDSTHTFCQQNHQARQYSSENKIRLLKTAVDASMLQQNEESSQRQLLSYSNTSQYMSMQDPLVQLKKILNLMGSKEHLNNHISQSISLLGYSYTVSKQFGNVLANSFVEYTDLAKRIQQKLKKNQIDLNDRENTSYNQEIVKLKVQKIALLQQINKMEQDNDQMKRKAQSKPLKFNNSVVTTLMKIFQEQMSKIMQKTIVFQSKIYLKLGYFQDSLIKLTNLRNNILQDKVNDNLWQENCRKYELENKRLQKTLKEKENMIQNYAMKEKKMSSQAARHRSERSLMDDQIRDLKKTVANVKRELEEQRSLYDRMIEKHLNLQKQIFLLSNIQGQFKAEGESFQIVDKQQMIYLQQSGIGPLSLSNQSSEE